MSVLLAPTGAQLTPQIPWLRVFVEGVVIVGSILLAFGIDGIVGKTRRSKARSFSHNQGAHRCPQER